MANTEGQNTAPTMVTSVQSSFTVEFFNVTHTRWSRWVKRLEVAFRVFRVPAELKVHYLLHYMGAEAYDTLCDKLAPAEPETQVYEDIVALMDQHFDPTPLEIAETFKFHSRKQQEGESVQEFIHALQKLSINCKFGAFLKSALRNQFVYGLHSKRIQSRLLETKDLTMERAVEIATGMELSERGANQLHRKPEAVAALQVTTAQGTSGTSNKYNSFKGSSNKKQHSNHNFMEKKCYRCGSNSHLANKCTKRNMFCTFCKINGHLKSVCTKYKATQVRILDVESNDNRKNDVLELLQMRDENDEQFQFRKKFMVTVCLDYVECSFEVDTGAAVSIMSLEQYKKFFKHKTIQKSDLTLLTYCDTKINVLGYIQVECKYKSIQKTLNLYIVPMNREPLLGREWLRQIKLDWGDISNITIQQTPNKVQKLLQKYPSLSNGEIGEVKNVKVHLTLKPNVCPVFKRARTVPFALLRKVENEIQNLENQGILVKVNTSEWATPVVPVVKTNGNIRLCGDFKVTINQYLQIDEHHLPTIDELFAKMAGGTKFTKIDISQAYLHVPVHPDDQHLLTLNTHKGLYKSTRLMYGVASAPAIFQRQMEKILEGIPGTTVFIDDIKLTAPDDETHLERLEIILQRLADHNLKINLKKSSFLQDSIEYCGYLIDKNGIRKIKSKIQAIQEMQRPTNVTEVRAFLGFINYYGRFFKNLSSLLQPLNNLLKINSKFIWNKECENAFKTVKERMQTDNVLCHYDPNLPLIVSSDASPYAVGAVLSHMLPDGTERPIQFASQTLSKTQQKYSQIDKEAYSIIFAVKKFYQYIYGRRFTLYTDHQPLVKIFAENKEIPALSATRMQHYALFLQAFTYDIKYKNTKLHANADALSRLPTKSEELQSHDQCDIFHLKQIEILPVSADQIALEIVKDLTLLPLLQALKQGKTIEPNLRFNIDQGEFSIQNGCIMRGIRVVIPKKLQKLVLEELHSAHFGITKMKGLARSYCWWKDIDTDIENLAKNCFYCNKIANNPTKVFYHPWEDPKGPFDRVHLDFAGPFNGVYYLLLIDAFTKWPEIHIMKQINSTNTIKILRNIFAQFGIPVTVVTDNGVQFTSLEFQNFMKMNGICHKRTAPYHPATNGQAERFVQTLKQSLRAMKHEGNSRELELAKMLLQYRKMPHSLTKQSPSQLMFGREIRSRLDLIKPNGDCIVKETIKDNNVRKFNLGIRVAVRDYVTKYKWMYGKIIEKLGTMHYLIRLDDNRVWKRHVNQIRKIGQNVCTDNIVTNTYYPVENTVPVYTYPCKNTYLCKDECNDTRTSLVDHRSPKLSNTNESIEADGNEQQNVDTSETTNVIPNVPEATNVHGEVQCALRRSTRVKRKPVRLDL